MFYTQQLFSENRTVYEIMSKNVVETEGPQMTWQYGAYALRAELAGFYMHLCAYKRPRARVPTCTNSRASMHTQTNIWSSLLFHGKNISQILLNITSCIHCPSCFSQNLNCQKTEALLWSCKQGNLSTWDRSVQYISYLALCWKLATL